MLYNSHLQTRDTWIIIKEKCVSTLHSQFNHSFYNHLGNRFFFFRFFFYLNPKGKQERPFNFIACRTLKYSLHSTFLLSTPLQEAKLVASVYAASIHVAFQPLNVHCESGLTVSPLLMASTYTCELVQRGTALQGQRLTDSVQSGTLKPGIGSDWASLLLSSSPAVSMSKNHATWIPNHRSLFVCVRALLPYLCIHVCMFMCGCGCVMHDHAEKSDCFIPALCAMGAGDVSLGSCMDGLRRSPSFIKRTPTCRIDLAKKQGGNSGSSILSDHKSLGCDPLGERWHHCQCSSPAGQKKGLGTNSCSYGGPQSVRNVDSMLMSAYINNGETKTVSRNLDKKSD